MKNHLVNGKRAGGKRGAAFTLIELMVVLVVIGIVSAVIIPEMKGTYEDSLLRSTSRTLVSAFDLAYSRAVSMNETCRVKLDQRTGRYVLEQRVPGDVRRASFAPVRDLSGGQGELDNRISIAFHRSDENPSDTGEQGPRPGAATESTISDGGPVIAFYADGTADGGEIQLRDRQGFRLVLKINPVTARVHIVELGQQDATGEGAGSLAR